MVPAWDANPQKLYTKPKKETAKSETPIIPELRGLNIHSPTFTSNIRDILLTFRAVVISKALQNSFPVRETTIAVINDPSEERKQVVLRLFTEAKASQAVAFWESLENDIQHWLNGLDERNRLIFLRDISLRIHWQ